MNNVISQLKTKLNEINELTKEPAYSSKYQIWDTTTERLLRQCLDSELLKIFSGILKVSSYASQADAQRMYLNHLQKKSEALKNLITMLETEYQAKKGDSDDGLTFNSIKLN